MTEPAAPPPCAVRWRQLESIDGRANDAFVDAAGGRVPAGTILDVTYRWMFDGNLNLAQFEVVQTGAAVVTARFVPNDDTPAAAVLATLPHLEALLAICLQQPEVRVDAEVLTAVPPRSGKRRPIRCEMRA